MEIVFNYVLLMYYNCRKINPNHGGSYVDPDWIKSNETAVNPINKKDNKCFQYATTVVLNYEETGKYAERITKSKPSINKYKWEGIKFSSQKDDWKKIEKNNVTITPNVILLMFQGITQIVLLEQKTKHKVCENM